MTNLKTVKEGYNKFCGPAVLSILTGKSTDECARAITEVNGHYNVTGVLLSDLLKAANNMGFDSVQVATSGSLFRNLTEQVNHDGLYIVAVTNHFVCIEIKDKQIYFCDNHTKEPIPAASSARLMMPILAMCKVTERPKPPEPELEEVLPQYREITTTECCYCGALGVSIADIVHYPDCRYRRYLEAIGNQWQTKSM